MGINDLTIGQAKELVNIFQNPGNSDSKGLNGFIGKKVIIRTYSAGVWFGLLDQKAGSEVILANARRMWRWWASETISLSGCAKYGIQISKSKIVEPVDYVWLEAIEILPCTDIAIKSIEGAPSVTPD